MLHRARLARRENAGPVMGGFETFVVVRMIAHEVDAPGSAEEPGVVGAPHRLGERLDDFWLA